MNKTILESGIVADLEGSIDDLLKTLYRLMDESKKKYSGKPVKLRFYDHKDGFNPGGEVTSVQCYEFYVEGK